VKGKHLSNSYKNKPLFVYINTRPFQISTVHKDTYVVYNITHLWNQSLGGVMGRPEKRWPWTYFLGLLVPKINRPRNTMSLHSNIPAIMHHIICIVQCIMTIHGHCVSGTIHFGDQGSQKFSFGTHRFGTPPLLPPNPTNQISSLQLRNYPIGRGQRYRPVRPRAARFQRTEKPRLPLVSYLGPARRQTPTIRVRRFR